MRVTLSLLLLLLACASAPDSGPRAEPEVARSASPDRGSAAPAAVAWLASRVSNVRVRAWPGARAEANPSPESGTRVSLRLECSLGEALARLRASGSEAWPSPAVDVGAPVHLDLASLARDEALRQVLATHDLRTIEAEGRTVIVPSGPPPPVRRRARHDVSDLLDSRAGEPLLTKEVLRRLLVQATGPEAWAPPASLVIRSAPEGPILEVEQSTPAVLDQVGTWLGLQREGTIFACLELRFLDPRGLDLVPLGVDLPEQGDLASCLIDPHQVRALLETQPKVSGGLLLQPRLTLISGERGLLDADVAPAAGGAPREGLHLELRPTVEERGEWVRWTLRWDRLARGPGEHELTWVESACCALSIPDGGTLLLRLGAPQACALLLLQARVAVLRR